MVLAISDPKCAEIRISSCQIMVLTFSTRKILEILILGWQNHYTQRHDTTSQPILLSRNRTIMTNLNFLVMRLSLRDYFFFTEIFGFIFPKNLL